MKKQYNFIILPRRYSQFFHLRRYYKHLISRAEMLMKETDDLFAQAQIECRINEYKICIKRIEEKMCRLKEMNNNA